MADYEPRGITVRDVAAADFIKAYAEHLKNTGRVELPSWCDLVKTAPHKEMCPYDQDWYYIRAAAVARKVYLRPGRGVGGLSKAFGTKARRGTMTNTHKPAATGIIRHVLQQLEALKVQHLESVQPLSVGRSGSRRYRGASSTGHFGTVVIIPNGNILFGMAKQAACLAIPKKVVEKMENGGRTVTRVGQQDLDRIAGAVVRGDD